METLSINTKTFASTPFLHMPGEWANLNAHHIIYKALLHVSILFFCRVMVLAKSLRVVAEGTTLSLQFSQTLLCILIGIIVIQFNHSLFPPFPFHSVSIPFPFRFHSISASYFPKHV